MSAAILLALVLSLGEDLLGRLEESLLLALHTFRQFRLRAGADDADAREQQGDQDGGHRERPRTPCAPRRSPSPRPVSRT